jgi:orotate phosphoribosyltransferase-like protein
MLIEIDLMIKLLNMDKYEVEFLEKIKQASQEMVVDRVELGELRLKRFAALVYVLIKEKQENFDLLVGGGNSGIAVLKIAKMVYQKVGLSVPPIALFPVERPSDGKTIKIDEGLISEQLKDIRKLSHLLFLDDEIMRGQTAGICFKTIKDFLGEGKVNSCLSCTIVAENHNFVWRHDHKGIAVRFMPFARVLQGYNGNFGYLIPEKMIEDLELVLGKPINRNQALAILLGGKKKLIKNDVALFDEKIEQEIASKISDYSQRKQEFIKRVEELVEQGIGEYQNGEIQLQYVP